MAYQYRGKQHDTPTPTKCGTRAGYADHYRKGTPKCGPCKKANAAYKREHKNATNRRK